VVDRRVDTHRKVYRTWIDGILAARECQVGYVSFTALLIGCVSYLLNRTRNADLQYILLIGHICFGSVLIWR